MYTKSKIFELAIGALLLQRRVVNADTDTTNECVVLRNWYDVALQTTLEDLDLDSTKETVALELIEADPNDEWLYAYKYPTNCAFLRRIVSGQRVDNRASHIPKIVEMYNGEKAIFCDTEQASAEIIVNDFPLSALSGHAGLCLAYNLASMAAPLITGKGAKRLLDELEKKYIVKKGQAQAHDQRENFNFVDDDVESEFVLARTE